MLNRCTILGGGITGLSAAWRLIESGLMVDVIETKNYIGGLAATVHTDGYMMDFGPHSLFSDDEEILKTIFNLLDDGILSGNRDVRLYMHGKYLKYPLKAEDIFIKLGFILSMKCFLSYIKQNLQRKSKFGKAGPNLEQWSIMNFGNALHELFFKPYTEQFWDVPCNFLSPDCIPTYKQINFFKTLKILVTPRNKRKDISIVDRELLPCYYPNNGFGSLSEKIAEKIIQAGGKIYTGFDVKSIWRTKDNKFVVTAQNENGKKMELETNIIISTIPIPSLMSMLMPDLPPRVDRAAQNIKYLSLVTLYIAVNKKEILDCMYEYSLEKPYNRITDVNQCTLIPPDQQRENMLSIEKSCHYGDKWWNMSKEDFLRTILPHLEAEGILKESEVKRIYLLKASHAYPMYLYNYQEHLDVFKEYIKTIPNLEICGRTGSFKYMDVDQCMKQAFQIADTIVSNLS